MFLLAIGGIAVLAFAQRQALSRVIAGVFSESRPVASTAPVVVTTPEPEIAAPDTVATPPMEYTIDAGHFTTRAEARAERAHLARLVAFEIAITDDAEGRHALWLGRFTSPVTADSVLNALQGRGLVPEATVYGYPIVTGDSAATASATPNANAATTPATAATVPSTPVTH